MHLRLLRPSTYIPRLVKSYHKRQGAIATSTYGAEFCAMRTAVEEVQAVRYMLRCLGVKVKHASLICGDNKGVVQNCTIPDSLLNKISEAGTFNEGFETSEYVAAAHLDMAYHTSTEDIKDIDKFEDDTLGELGLIPQIESRYRSTYFGHIFAGGYSSGYYSYLWTEVLEADAFEPFREKGLFDKETATKLKEYVYASGNTEDLMTQYINYRGSEPKIEPLLKKRGLD